MSLIAHPVIPTPLPPEVALPIALASDVLDTPAVLVDLDVVEANIGRMASLARDKGVGLRPHIKTHKSLAMAQRQIAAGATGLCVATASEAVTFGTGLGGTEILLAYPLVGGSKLARVAPLLRSGQLTLVADSEKVLASYADFAVHLGVEVPVLIEVDTGQNRAGALPLEAVKLAAQVAGNPHLQLRGIMTHAGHAHDAPDAEGIKQVARDEARLMGEVREDIEALGIEVPVVSAGSTITAPYLSAEDGITEIRPGTYVYNDLRTLGRWACTWDDMAVGMVATVVSRGSGRATIDAGNKSLTSSRDEKYAFGCLRAERDVRIVRLSEEHGVIAVPMTPVDGDLQIGEHVQVMPIHVCVWMDLQREVYGVRNGQIVERITVDGMRHSL